MEKKTIGTFIAVLRKASGMTQRELAERLNVSDKSVSRWERDECAPDLSLIPVIAEIFDITADELLRGERKVPAGEDSPSSEERSLWKKEKSTRQFQNLLRTQDLRLKERSTIALGVGFFGWLAALVCNFAFYRATLGFFLSLAFYAVAVILEICFLRRAAVEENDAFDREKWITYQNSTVKVGIRTLFAVWLFLGATMPLLLAADAYVGIALPSYFLAALVFAAGFLIVGYLLVVLVGKPLLIKHDLFRLTEEKRNNAMGKRKLLAKTAGISTLLAALLLAVAVAVSESTQLFVESLRFDDYESFKTYIETGTEPINETKDGLLHAGYIPMGESGSIPLYIPSDTEELEEEAFLETVEDKNGNVLFTYAPKNTEVFRVRFSFDESENGLPIYVITYSAMARASDITALISAILVGLIALDYLIAAGFYFIKARKYA